MASLIGVLLLAGCHKSDQTADDISIEHEVTPHPVSVGVSKVMLRLRDSAGNPITGAGIQLEGTMTHPGMRPVFSEARETAPGDYESSVEFMMAGDWIVILRITLKNGDSMERRFEVRGVRPGW